jgi:hypothetical protein
MGRITTIVTTYWIHVGNTLMRAGNDVSKSSTDTIVIAAGQRGSKRGFGAGSFMIIEDPP